MGKMTPQHYVIGCVIIIQYMKILLAKFAQNLKMFSALTVTTHSDEIVSAGSFQGYYCNWKKFGNCREMIKWDMRLVTA